MKSNSEHSGDDTAAFHQCLHDAIRNSTLRHVVLSGVRPGGDRNWQRTDIRPVRLRAGLHYQIARRVGRQEFHENVPAAGLLRSVKDWAGSQFREVRITTGSGIHTAYFNRRGLCRLRSSSRGGTQDSESNAAEHDRQRHYIIPEGRPCPFLIHTGVMTAEGKVRASAYHKFRQINRYLEFVADALRSVPDDQSIRVIDFGSGKSYLTFAVHYMLQQLQGRSAEIIGVDERPEMTRTCREIAEALGLTGIRFECGTIRSLPPSEMQDVQLVISLHACDTATDDAIAQAVRMKVPIIMAVPCCQKEMSARLENDTEPLILGHGILRDRYCQLATDALRAALLEGCGYRSAVCEFIDLEHSGRNVLIRAVRRDSPAEESCSGAVQTVREYSERMRLPALHLQRRLEEYGILPPSADHVLPSAGTE